MIKFCNSLIYTPAQEPPDYRHGALKKSQGKGDF